MAISAAAEKWAKFTGEALETATLTLRTYADVLASTEQVTAATAVRIVVRASEWAIANDELDLATVVELFASEVDTTADALESEV